jgi:hypothetical protein
MVQFPGGYIAEIHSLIGKPSASRAASCSLRKVCEPYLCVANSNSGGRPLV